MKVKGSGRLTRLFIITLHTITESIDISEKTCSLSFASNEYTFPSF